MCSFRCMASERCYNLLQVGQMTLVALVVAVVDAAVMALLNTFAPEPYMVRYYVRASTAVRFASVRHPVSWRTPTNCLLVLVLYLRQDEVFHIPQTQQYCDGNYGAYAHAALELSSFRCHTHVPRLVTNKSHGTPRSRRCPGSTCSRRSTRTSRRSSARASARRRCCAASMCSSQSGARCWSPSCAR